MALKALTLWRPWPWTIFDLPPGYGVDPKQIENRPWAPPPSIIGKPIALHAGKTFDDDSAESIAAELDAELTEDGLKLDLPDIVFRKELHPIGIVGLVTVARWFRFEKGRYSGGEPPPRQTIWTFGPCCWVLTNIRPLREPVFCKGAQGMWLVPPEIERRVREQL